MKDINKVILLGRLGADPIQRKTKSGLAVTHFSIATSHRTLKSVSGETESETESSTQYKEETQWHRIIAWGKQAESCNQYLHKGSAVYVEGFIRSRNYADKQGDQKTTFEVHAETVSFLSSKSADQRPALKLAASE